MQKYLKFNTTAGVHNVPVGNGLYVEKVGLTETRLYSADAFLYGAAPTAELTESIMTALIQASATTWQHPEVEVSLPAGAVVASIALTLFS
jgi:hypothetical protein